MKEIVIIGNGISGVTAARHIRKRSDYKITLISSESKYFFSRTALMYVYMGHLKSDHLKPYEDWFWKKNRIDLVFDHVTRIDTESRKLQLKSRATIQYDVLILATGSKSARAGWPGENALGVQGLYSYQDLQLLEENTKGIRRAVIVGGGLIGVELAEMLHSRKIDVTMLVREPEFWSNVLPLQEAAMISRHIHSRGVNLLTNTQLKRINSDDHNKVVSVTTETGEIIPCEFVGLTIGVEPNIEVLAGSGITTNRGVVVNEYLQTNKQNIYAIGDCVERSYELSGRKNIEQVWYTGRMMGEVVAQTICGIPTPYEPGPWFNSAKFFDIEYQAYGNVGHAVKDSESDFYWEHASGRKAIHLVWDKQSLKFIGINAFGIRYRHESFDRWLREGRDIHYVLRHLHEANFDPEFAIRHEGEITNAFNSHYASTVMSPANNERQ